MDISDKYIEELPIDLIDACHKVIEDAFAAYNKAPKNYNGRFKALAPYYAITQELTTKIPEISNIDEPALSTNHNGNVSAMFGYLQAVKTIINGELVKRNTIADVKSIDDIRKHFRMYTGKEFCYSFTDGDIAKIQQLLNELRDAIRISELFNAKHKQRILNKLEGLQSELHKKMSNLDRLWGLIGEAGVVLGKFGKDAKPFADRIREIAQITWRTQANAEELPSGTILPLLSDGKQEDK